MVVNVIWEAKNRQAAVREFTRFKARWWTDEERAVRGLERVLKDCLTFVDEPPEFGAACERRMKKSRVHCSRGGGRAKRPVAAALVRYG